MFFLFTSWERDYKNKIFKLNVIKYFQNSSHYSKFVLLAISKSTVMVLMVCLCTFLKMLSVYNNKLCSFVVVWDGSVGDH